MAKIRLVKFERDRPTVREFTYTIPNMMSISYELNSPVTPTPLPEETAEDNVLIKMEGNSSKISLRWKIKNFEESLIKENTTIVRSLRDQLGFFKNMFIPSGIEDSYELIINFDDTDNDDQSDNVIAFMGTFTKFRFDTSGSEPITFNMSADFLEGTVATVHDIDVPSEPLNIIASVTNDDVTIAWDPPDLEDDIDLTGYRLRYRRTAPTPNDWFIQADNIQPNTDSYTITGLSDGRYIFELTGKSTRGDGRTAREVVIVDTS